MSEWLRRQSQELLAQAAWVQIPFRVHTYIIKNNRDVRVVKEKVLRTFGAIRVGSNPTPCKLFLYILQKKLLNILVNFFVKPMIFEKLLMER